MPNPRKEPEKAPTSSAYATGTVGSAPKSRATTIPNPQTRTKRRQTTIGCGAVSRAITINYVSSLQKNSTSRRYDRFEGVTMPLLHPGVDILRYREGDLEEEKK